MGSPSPTFRFALAASTCLRTVKNWISGRYAPSGRHLVVLAQHSDQVLNAILSMAGREDLLLAREVEDLRRKVLQLAAVIGDPMPKFPSPGS
jgi:hypothetical protein